VAKEEFEAMTDFDPNDDRFSDLKREPDEGAEAVTRGELVLPLVSERPMGAQRLAVMRRPTAEILAELKALGSAAGKDWYYRFPVKRKVRNEETGREEWATDYIEGSSIKLANDLARTFGNCDVDVRVVEDGQSWVFYARFIDLQTGFSMTRPFQQRKSQGSVMGKSDRQRDIAFQIGASKAIRNVICNALQTYADYALEQAQQSIVERFARDLPGSRTKAAERTKERGWDIKRVERVIGKVVGEWLAPDLAKVSAMFKAVDDGMISFDECFPSPNAPAVDNPLGQQSVEVQHVAEKQHDRQISTGAEHSDPGDIPEALRRKPASAVLGAEATQTAPAAKNEPAASLRSPGAIAVEEGRAAKSISERAAAARGLPPHEVVYLDPGEVAEAKAKGKDLGAVAKEKLAERTYYQEAMAYIANATVEGTLTNWWKGQRSDRLSAGLVPKEMQALTDAYWSRHIALSEVE
jgi:hypothetical protein